MSVFNSVQVQQESLTCTRRGILRINNFFHIIQQSILIYRPGLPFFVPPFVETVGLDQVTDIEVF